MIVINATSLEDFAQKLAFDFIEGRLGSLYDRVEMNLGNLQRGGDISQLLALLSGDALVGKQREELFTH